MRTLRPFLTGIVAFVLLLGPTAGAGEPERKAVVELVHLVTSPETYKAMLEQMSTQLLASMQASGQTKMQPDAATRLRDAVSEAMPYEDVVSWTADIYATRFTLGEIKDLTSFYKTATGRKLARMLPEISGEMGKRMGPILMTRMPAAMKKHGLMQ